MTKCLLLCFVLFGVSANAQITIGLTQKPDTSYTTYSAFKSTAKKYPDIKIVPQLDNPMVTEQRNIVYGNTPSGALQLDAFYPRVRTPKLRTAILIVHGGGWRSGTRQQHIPMAQHLAALGYACFTTDYRLSTYAQYPAAVYYLKAAIRWLHAHAKTYSLDTSRICILGFSAGGELAAFVAATNQDPQFEGDSTYSPHYSSKVSALIDIDGTLSFVHPESGEGDDSKAISAATYWLGYAKKDKPALWAAASPLNHVSPRMPPTLFINSSVARMHAGRDDFRQLMQQYHTYTEVQAFTDAPHSFCLFTPWFNPTIQYIDDFLKRVFLQK